MKVNPIGIQSYQQLERCNNANRAVSGARKLTDADPSVTISPQAVNSATRLAVKTHQGDYSEILTNEERSALEILFRRFSSPERFGPTYQRGSSALGENPRVGSIVDVKV